MRGEVADSRQVLVAALFTAHTHNRIAGGHKADGDDDVGRDQAGGGGGGGDGGGDGDATTKGLTSMMLRCPAEDEDEHSQDEGGSCAVSSASGGFPYATTKTLEIHLGAV